MEEPCLNPDCNSVGAEHPNCQCYGGMAKGGIVTHEKGCPYYKGGEVDSGFSIAEDNDTHYTIKHPKGDVLKIAKAGLSKDLLSKIQTFKKGGQVQSVESKFKEATEGSQPEMTLASTDKTPPVVVNVGATTPQQDPSATLDSSSIPGQNQQALTPQQPTESVGPQASKLPNAEQAYNTGIANVKAGAANEAAAQTAIAKEATLAHEKEVQSLADIQTKFQNTYDHVSSEQTKLAQEIQNGKVDFNRLWRDAGTGNKILAGIGIALSGMGSGLTGQPNLALKVINDAIDRDIAQQKEELGKKKTALSSYNEILQNADHAAQVLKSVSQAAVMAQINKITSSQGGTLAKAKQQLLLGEMIPKMEAEKFNYAVNRAKWEYDEDQASQQAAAQKQIQNAPENMKEYDLGRTGEVNMRKLNHLVLSGIINPEEAGKVRQEAQDYQDAQKEKAGIIEDLSQMKDAITQNREIISKNKSIKGPLIGMDPLTINKAMEFAGSLPLIGHAVEKLESPTEIGNQYSSAKARALLRVSRVLGKRMTPDVMKQVEKTLYERGDSDEELKRKTEALTKILDSNTPTINLEGRGLLK